MRFASYLVAVVLAVSAPRAEAGRVPIEDVAPHRGSSSEATSLGALREEKRFGVGVTAGGPLGVFGLQADVHVNDWLSVNVGYGTGIEFTTWNFAARAILPGQWVAPWFGLGLARWWTDGTPERRPGPSLLADRLLSKTEDPTKGFSAYLLYPAIGVDWALPSGLTFTLELDSLFRLFSMRQAFYGGAAARWYF